MRVPVAALAVLAFAACAPPDDEAAADGAALGVERDAIVGGATDPGDPEVFMLMMQYDTGTGSGCTATLIAPRTLLTASHCVDPRIASATTVDIYAVNITDATTGAGDFIHVIETRMHPLWNPTVGLDGDVAMVLLERAPTNVPSPKPWNTASVSALTGKPLRAVGYGTTGADGAGAGLKRTVGLTFRSITSTHINLGDLSGKGVCHGDSGGPSFYTFPDGVERQVGIHSYTNNTACTDGADVRTDYYAAFINQWLNEKEGPQCSRDGLCKTGCSPVDLDCYCLADGVCNPQCPSLLDDPDCPKDCVANGVCSTKPCPVPDVDCVADGSTCTSEMQCLGRKCISDSQHPTFYCTKSCSLSTDCPAGMTCPGPGSACSFALLPTAGPGQSCLAGQTFCAGNVFVCSGPPGGSTTCVPSCQSGADCPSPQTCEAGQNGFKYCREPPRPIIVLTRAKAEGYAALSCAQAGGAPASLALLLALAAGHLARRRPTRSLCRARKSRERPH